MKRTIFFTVLIASMIFTNCNAGSPDGKSNNPAKGDVVVQLTNENFKKTVFDYEKNKEWKFEGTKPVIIDFYADWCGPCRQLSPLVEEIARQYEGKIVVYKVDTDKERTLAQNLGISSLPTLLFIPARGKPQITVGVLPKESLVKAVNEILLIR